MTSNPTPPEEKEKFSAEKSKGREIATSLRKNPLSWAVLGGGSYRLTGLLAAQRWADALLTFGITAVLVGVTAYGDGILMRLQEILGERGKKRVDTLNNKLDQFDQWMQWKLANPEEKYLRCQGNFCKSYTTEGMAAGSFFVPILDEVFVSLELSHSFHTREFPMPKGLQWDEKTLREITNHPETTIWEILKESIKIPSYKRLAMLADGGYGKSTLLRHITYVYTHKTAKRPKNIPQLLPVLIYLRTWQKLLAEKPDLTLAEFIQDHHIPHLPEGKELLLPEDWVIKHLRKGDFLIMFDGFDEVKEEWRSQMSQWIGQQMHNYPNAYFLITSRPSGYKAYLAEEKPTAQVTIKPFNQSQREGFIHRWYLCQESYARGGRKTPDVLAIVAEKENNLLAQFKEKSELEDLAKNPLLLHMIVMLHHGYASERLPKRRSELYREILRLQLGDRPLVKKIKMSLMAEESQRILQKIAFFMVTRNQPQIEEKMLLKIMEKVLPLFDESIIPRDFLRQIEDVSEILILKDEAYEFAHLSFLGYLAAVEILEQKKESLLLENWDKAWWRETILLYTATVKNPSALIRSFLELKNQQAVDLALACLRETPKKIDEDLNNRVAKIQMQEVQIELKDLELETREQLYKPLENYLKTGQWKEADQETFRVMLQVANRESEGWLNSESIEKFPCPDLKIIDQLWVQYSNGKFGFSVQKKIWLDCGGVVGQYEWEPIKKVWNTVDWSKPCYDLDKAKYGHLPFTDIIIMVDGEGILFPLFSRVQICKL